MTKKKNRSKPPIKQSVRRFLSPRAYGMVLGVVVIVVLSFFLRTVNQWDLIFVNNQVWFRGVDSDYHMRLIDAMMYNFPRPLKWDMYGGYPDGGLIGFFPMLAWVTVMLAKISHINYEVVGALVPPLMGALVIIPVFFLGKQVFSTKVGFLGAFIVAILPGELFHRTLLGFTDHHALEVLLLPTIMLMFYLAYTKKRWLWVIGSGLSLGAYILTWQASSFVMFIIGVWFWLRFLISVKDDKPDYWACVVTAVSGVIALIVSIPFIIGMPTFFYTIGMCAILIVLPSVMFLLTKMFKKELFLFSLTILVPVGFAIMDGVLLTVSNKTISWYSLLGQVFWGFGTTIQEVEPISLSVLFATFGITVFLGLGGLYFAIKKKVNLIFLVYAVITIVAMFGQRRWGYYSTVTISILAAFAIFELSSFVRENTRPVVVGLIAIFAVISVFQGTLAISALPNNITPDWYKAMVWLKDNSPDPFEEWNKTHELKAYDTVGLLVKANYGVLSWWDYGNWIIRDAQRVPIDSPVHANIVSTWYLDAQNEDAAEKVLKDANYNIKYVVLDESVVTTKWYAVAERGQYGYDYTGKWYPNSQAARLWNNTSQYYKLVHIEGNVRIWERVK